MKSNLFLLILVFCIKVSFVQSQCAVSISGSSIVNCSPVATVTLSANHYSTSAYYTHKWYTTQTGTTTVPIDKFWSPTGGVYVSQKTVSGYSNIEYWVAGVCSDGKESARTKVSLTIAPTQIKITPSTNPTYVCAATGITLTATGGTNYVWTKGSPGEMTLSTSSSYKPTSSGTYYLAGTNNCGQRQVVSIPVTWVPLVGPFSSITGPTSRLQGGGTSTYKATCSGATLIWSMSPTSSGTINSSTGLVTWNSSFAGTATVRVYASGCGVNSFKSLDVIVSAPSPCTTPPTGSNIVKCGSSTQNVTLQVASSSSLVTGHVWFTSETGSTTVTPNTSYSPVSGIWTSSLNVSGYQSVSYWVASRCSNTTALSSRTKISYTFTSSCRLAEPEETLVIDSKEVRISPNPSSGNTTISYSLNKASKVTLAIFDTDGNRIKEIISSVNQSKGTYEQTIDTKALGLPSKMYIIKLISSDKVITKKLVVK